MREAIVTGLVSSPQRRYLVTLASGREVICSVNHRWLARRSQNIWQWRPLRALKPGDELLSLGAPWESDETHEGGWLAGIYDGEGALVDVQTKRPGHYPDPDGTRGRFGVFFSQNEGPVLSRTMALLAKFGFQPTAPHRSGAKNCRTIEITGLYNALRLLGSIRPGRLIARASVLWLNKTFMGNAESIESIVSIGDGEMIDITTSSGTFLAEGLVSHNSHPSYTRWFNEAFGRLGWSLVPVGKPALSGRSVVCPYVLFIHGKPVRFAYGEQEYFEANKEQTYGDALESTVASALRRVAKRLGVGLELWDPAFGERFILEHCLQVPCRRRDGSVTMQWRRRQDPKFWNELNANEARHAQPAQRQTAPEYEAPVEDPPAGHHRASGQAISDPQRKRLWVIIRNSGRGEQTVREWFEHRFQWTSSKQVTRDLYEYVCTAIEAPGPLPEKR